MHILRTAGVLSAAALCAAVVALAGAADAGADADANKRLVATMYEEGINAKDPIALGEYLTDDFISHDPDGEDIDRDAHLWGAGAFFIAFPDGRIEIDDMIAEDDRVAVRWSFTGTQRGPLDELPATGAEVELTGISIHRIEDGRVAETWEASNTLLFLQQLGVIPTE